MKYKSLHWVLIAIYLSSFWLLDDYFSFSTIYSWGIAFIGAVAIGIPYDYFLKKPKENSKPLILK